MIRIAEDIQREFQQFDLINFLNEAVRLASERPNLNPTQYRDRSAQLKKRAQTVISDTIFRTYPLDLMTLISQSEFSSVLPANLAKVVISGFPENKEAAISSAELQMYLNQAQSTLGQVVGFLTFARRLGVAPYNLPEGFVSLDLKIPRAIFNSHVGSFLSKTDVFNEFMRSVTEFVTGSRDEIELVYISTSDPVLSCAVIPAAAWAILYFYKLLLEVAEKQINVFKAVNDLRTSGLAADKVAPISDEMKAMIEREVKRAVETASERIPSSVDAPRKNELKVQVTKQAIEITADIAEGARIYVSLESQQQLEVIAQAAPEGAESITALREQVEEQKALEARLDGITAALPIQALAAHRNNTY